jgi:hypothetical protein
LGSGRRKPDCGSMSDGISLPILRAMRWRYCERRDFTGSSAVQE